MNMKSTDESAPAFERRFDLIWCYINAGSLLLLYIIQEQDPVTFVTASSKPVSLRIAYFNRVEVVYFHY